MLKFDLSNIPSDAEVTSAQLSLNFVFGNNVSEVCTLFVLTKDWIEKEITWSNAKNGDPWSGKLSAAFPDTLRNDDGTFVQPLVIDSIIEGGGDYTQINKSMATTVTGETWEEYNVKDAIQEMIKKPQSNFGFLLQVQENNKGRYYTSSNSDLQDKRPKLAISYSGSTNAEQLVNNSKARQSLRIQRLQNDLRIDVPINNCYKVSIDNISGKRLFKISGDSQPQSFMVPLSLLSNGMYIVSVKHAGGLSVFHYFMTN